MATNNIHPKNKIYHHLDNEIYNNTEIEYIAVSDGDTKYISAASIVLGFTLVSYTYEDFETFKIRVHQVVDILKPRLKE